MKNGQRAVDEYQRSGELETSRDENGNHRITEWLGWKGTLKIVESWNGWVGKILKSHRTLEWLGWKGP